MKVLVTIPITGTFSTEVEVPDGFTKEQVYEAATSAWDGDQTNCTVYWEFTQTVCEGNVFHGVQNLSEYKVLNRDGTKSRLK